jgi:hypothetical protein
MIGGDVRNCNQSVERFMKCCTGSPRGKLANCSSISRIKVSQSGVTPCYWLEYGMSNDTKSADMNDRGCSARNEGNRGNDTAQKAGQQSQDASRHQQDASHHKNDKDPQRGGTDDKSGPSE